MVTTDSPNIDHIDISHAKQWNAACEQRLNSYLQMILEELRNDQTGGKFLIINPPLNRAMKSHFFLPKIFVWSLQDKFIRCTLQFPVHKCTLQPWKFTSEAGAMDRNPRLTFDLFGNILLVQPFYLCKIRGGILTKLLHHLMTSCSLYHTTFRTSFQSLFLHAVIILIKFWIIVRGVNFAKISEAKQS